MKYQNSIEELNNLSDEHKIQIHKLEYWLKKYQSLFQETHRIKTCHDRTLPCYCKSRHLDCFFKDIYSGLDQIFNAYLINLTLEKEVKKYHSLKDNLFQSKKVAKKK